MDNNIKLNISCVSFRWFRSIWSVVSSDRRDWLSNQRSQAATWVFLPNTQSRYR